MKTSIPKFLILIICFFAYSFNAVANDTIRFTWQCESYKSFIIKAIPDKQFTIDWGDGIIEIDSTTGIEENKSLGHTYAIAGDYNVILAGVTEDCLFTALNLTYPWPLHSKYVTSLDISNCAALEMLYCYDNCLQLNDLYNASQMISEPLYKLLGEQYLGQKEIEVGVSIDYSAQNELSGIATVFTVEKYDSLGYNYPADLSNYTITNGVITFNDTGVYILIMTNAAIVSHPYHSVQVITCYIVKNNDETAITEAIQESTSLKIYPNPTTGKLTINNGELPIKDIEILDIFGKNVGARPFLSTENRMDISHLPTGIYFLRVDGKMIKVIKK